MNNDGHVRGSVLLHNAAVLFANGKNEAASRKAIDHLRQHPDDFRGLALLGKIALEDGALAQGEYFLRHAIRIGDHRSETRRDLATALLRQDILDEALEAFTALAKSNDDPHFYATSALILDRLGRHDEAIKAHRATIKRKPDDSRYRITYGHSLRFAGRTNEAIAVYRAVVNEDPERGEAWWALTDIKTNALTDADMAQIHDALGYAIDPLNLVPLHKALGRSYAHRGKYAESFRHYAEGNKLRANVTRYDPGELSRDVDQFIALTERHPMPAPACGGAHGGPAPIFLVSLPRSGSTLLEQILDQHPNIEGRGELPYIRALMRQGFERHLRAGVTTSLQLLQAMSVEERIALGGEYLRRAALHRRSTTRFFIDKMPTNWIDVLFIRSILPQAYFITIRRNSLDCCLSNHFHHFGVAHAASYDLVSQGRCYADYARFMDHLEANSPGAILNVRYENLLEDPRGLLHGVLARLGLGWDDALLKFHRSSRNVRTPSAEQVRQPLNRKGVGIWQNYAEWLGPLREALGPYADV